MRYVKPLLVSLLLAVLGMVVRKILRDILNSEIHLDHLDLPSRV